MTRNGSYTDSFDEHEWPQFILSESLSWQSSSTDNDTYDNKNKKTLKDHLECGLMDMKSSLGERHPDVAFVANKIGDACAKNHDFEDALQFYTEALKLKRLCLSPFHVDVADTLRSIGLVAKELQLYDKSLSVLTKALSIYQKSMGQNDLNFNNPSLQKSSPIAQKIAHSHNDIGNIYFCQHKNKLAMENYQESLRIYRALCRANTKTMEEESPSKRLKAKVYAHEIQLMIAESLNNIASVCAETNDRTKAIYFYNEALCIQMRGLGEDDPAVAGTLNNIGTMNFKAGNYEAALKSYKQALKMQRCILGPDHLDNIDSILNIAATHTRARHFRQAKSFLVRALNIAVKSLSKNNIKVAKICSKLGKTAVLRGRDEEALKHYTDAVTIYKSTGLKNDHPLVQSSSQMIARIKYRNQGELSSIIHAASEIFTNMFCQGTSTHQMGPSLVGCIEVDAVRQ